MNVLAGGFAPSLGRTALTIDVIFDPVCPWCYIGKRRLERALAMRPALNVGPQSTSRVSLRWRPFLLNPDLPREGIDRTTHLVKKFGSEQRVRRIFGAIREAGLSVEIHFAFERIKRTPNSVDAHRLVRYADTHGKADRAVEALFKAYFERGCDTGDRQELLSIGRDLELPYEALDRYLRSETDIDVVYEENARAHRLGISGVPSYLFNGAMMISGAQEPKVLARMIDAAITTSSD
ncbi:MAG: DsbA family oxidoreductase [Rhodobacterales bacterium]|nr:DsbA family oxidoreductase [Rhodobacterales bacterium]